MTEDTTTAEIDQEEDLHDLLGWWSYVGSGGYTLPAVTDYAAGSVVAYGSEFNVSAAMLAASRDRNGHSNLITALRSVDEQLRQFAEVKFKRGCWPPDTMRSLPGSVERLMALSDERRSAQSIRDPDVRAETLRSLRIKYGEDWLAGSRSRTIGQRFGGRHLPDE